MYCSKCGKEAQEGEKFCSGCGNKLLDIAVGTDSDSKPVAQQRDRISSKKIPTWAWIVGVCLIWVIIIGVVWKSAKNNNMEMQSDPPIMNYEEDELTSKVQCAPCSGTGKITCSSCLGRGTETIVGSHNASNDWLGERRTCRAGCRGTGEVDCEYCNGTGWR